MVWTDVEWEKAVKWLNEYFNCKLSSKQWEDLLLNNSEVLSEVGIYVFEHEKDTEDFLWDMVQQVFCDIPSDHPIWYYFRLSDYVYDLDKSGEWSFWQVWQYDKNGKFENTFFLIINLSLFDEEQFKGILKGFLR